MGRWEPDARGRLEQAALALYLERGFENTTVAEIAERAGLTERTFFRYFADKREVLFSGSAIMKGLLVQTAVDAPSSTAPHPCSASPRVECPAEGGVGFDATRVDRHWARVTVARACLNAPRWDESGVHHCGR